MDKSWNLVAEINGHHIYRADDGVHCHLWTQGVGFWGFQLSEEYARRTCAIVAPAKPPDPPTGDRP